MNLKQISILAVALGVAACEMPVVDDGPSPAALAALPTGIDPSFLIKDGNGCYGIAVEQTEPQTGVALLDASGQQVCDA